MRIERFVVPGLAQFSYVISSDGQAAVIDAKRDIGEYLEYAAEEKLRITRVLETHIHADFAAGSTALAKATGAELLLSGHDEGEHYLYAMPHRKMRDGDAFELGKVRIQALHTPGHTPEHLSFLLFDLERSSATPAALLSGDFLFVGSLGRPDLLGEEAKRGLAHELYLSASRRIATLPDGLEIYPGHGAGSLCGAGMSERPQSTLGYERAANTLFTLSEEAFISEIIQTVPPMPDYYPRMKKLNSSGAPGLAAIPGGRSLTPAEVQSLAGREDVFLLDIRDPESFGGAYIPGAINIGADDHLSLWAGWLIDPAKRIVLIGSGGDYEEEEARKSLVRVSLDKIEGFLERGMSSWLEEGLELERLPQLSTGDVAVREPKTVVVDVRSQTEWESGHVEGAKHIALGDLGKSMGELPREKHIVTVCGSGYRSSVAASLLKAAGFVSVASMNGGMAAWKRRNLPLSRN